MIDYIAVYHWEGHSPEAPVKIEAKTWDAAEEELTLQAIQFANDMQYHLEYDDVESPEQYVSDYFHIDFIVPLSGIRTLNKMTGGV